MWNKAFNLYMKVITKITTKLNRLTSYYKKTIHYHVFK
jgi:hypothetical protein